MIVSWFRAALDLDTYRLSNLIRPQCAERAKPGRGQPVLIMHIGFFACFHAIPLKCSRFNKIATLQTDRHTDHRYYRHVTGYVSIISMHRPSTVTLAAHARRRLIIIFFLHITFTLYILKGHVLVGEHVRFSGYFPRIP